MSKHVEHLAKQLIEMNENCYGYFFPLLENFYTFTQATAPRRLLLANAITVD